MTAFTSFAFKATGTTADRTMPDRLAEIHNVLDFGADPTGNTDSTSAIQSAVDWTSGANRGTIYFPLGSYVATSPITFNYDGDLAIRFLGEFGTVIFGTVNGYVFDRHLATPNNTKGGRIFERLLIVNAHASGGCIRLGSTLGGAMRDCVFSGFIGVTTEDSAGNSSQNIQIQNCKFSGGGATGSKFIIIGGGGAIEGSDIGPGGDIGVLAYGKGLHISGCRSENCNTSFLLGNDSANNPVGLQGFSCHSTSTEGCVTAWDFGGTGGGLVEGFTISSCYHLGHPVGNAGADQMQESLYGIRIRADCADAGIIQAFQANNHHGQYGIAIASATSRKNIIIRDTSSVVNTGTNWSLPSNAYTARLRNCNTAETWTYSQLPTGGNVLEGDEYDITDSNTATWGATAAGSGSNHVRVRYNGSNYTVVGK